MPSYHPIATYSPSKTLLVIIIIIIISNIYNNNNTPILLHTALALPKKSETPKPIDIPPPDTFAIHLPFSTAIKKYNITDIIDNNDINNIIQSTDEAFLLFIYDSLDPNSYKAAYNINIAAGYLDGFVKVKGIDIRRPSLLYTINAFNIYIIPSLLLISSVRNNIPKYASTRVTSLPYNKILLGGTKYTSVKYNNNIFNSNDIKTFALTSGATEGENRIIKLNKDNQLKQIEDILSFGTGNIAEKHFGFAILVSDRDKSSALYKSLALQYNKRILFFEVNGRMSPVLLERFGCNLDNNNNNNNNKKMPCLRLYPPATGVTPTREVEELSIYKGQLQIKNIMKFFDEDNNNIINISVWREMQREMTSRAILRYDTLYNNNNNIIININNKNDWNEMVVQHVGVTSVLLSDISLISKVKVQIRDVIGILFCNNNNTNINNININNNEILDIINEVKQIRKKTPIPASVFVTIDKEKQSGILSFFNNNNNNNKLNNNNNKLNDNNNNNNNNNSCTLVLISAQFDEKNKNIKYYSKSIIQGDITAKVINNIINNGVGDNNNINNNNNIKGSEFNWNDVPLFV